MEVARRDFPGGQNGVWGMSLLGDWGFVVPASDVGKVVLRNQLEEPSRESSSSGLLTCLSIGPVLSWC